MRSVLFTPKWAGLTALLILTVGGCVTLGLWQWGRAHSAAQPQVTGEQVQPLSEIYGLREPIPVEEIGVRVKVSGRYDASRQLLVPDRQEGGQPGYWVLTPLEVQGGGALPIVRGWIADPSSGGVEPPKGVVSVVGRLEPSEGEDLRPTNDALLPQGQVGIVSSAELVSLWSPDLYYGFVILQEQQPRSTLPAVTVSAPVTSGPISWQNFAYAIQWWLFAAFACFFWWRVLQADLADRRLDADRHDRPSSPVPPELSEVRE